jgi:hypothetical protein
MISRKRRRKEMSTTMEAGGAKAVAPKGSSIQDIPKEKISKSKTNPRGHFDQANLAELAENIRQHGALQALLVPLGFAIHFHPLDVYKSPRAARPDHPEECPKVLKNHD